MNAIDPERERGQAQVAPAITVTRGRPTAAELAAVTAVLFAAASAAALAADAAAAAGPSVSSPWAESARPRPGALPRPGRRAWRASALPR